MALEMRPVAADEVRAIVEVDGLAFGLPERTDSMVEHAEAVVEPDRTHVVFDDGRPVAAAAALSWELTLPLPKGRYHYRFDVDGQERVDPECKDSEEAGGRTASLRDIP